MIDWLNQNQGLVAVLLAVLTAIGSLIFKLFSKSEAPHITAGGNISAGGDILVGTNTIKPTMNINNNLGSIQQAGHDIINSHVQRPKIDLNGDMPVSGGSAGNWINFNLVNTGNDTAVDIKYYLSYDDAKTDPIRACSKLAPGEKSSKIEYIYTNTDIFKKEVSNLKIHFVYNDTDWHAYHSGRNLKQKSRADGNYDINGYIEDYFSL